MIDFHIHTKLCRHAEGEVIDYINYAELSGIRQIGFSDHFPMNYQPKFSNDIKNITMREFEIEDYIKIINNEKIKNKNLEIRLGFEVDYYEKENLFFKKYTELYHQVDYIIGSVHFIDELSVDQEEFSKERKDFGLKSFWEEYFKAIFNLIKNYRDMIDVIGHLDLPKKFGDKMPDNLNDFVSEILDIIYQNELVLEINTSGYFKPVGEPYPSIDIIKLAKSKKVEFTIGSDAHSPKEIARGFEKILPFLKELEIRRLITFKNHKKDYYKIF